jgi:8-oxo-dGTP pyrophosphatase MutT (NUDIX family)
MSEAGSEGAASKPRLQYAALPLGREPNGALRVMLVTSRETKRWIIPKGWPIKGLEGPDVAAREAYEEAGLKGEIGAEPVGSYTYEKRLKNRDLVTCLVQVFPLEVRKQLKRWPEKVERHTQWFAPEQAAALVGEADLAALIRKVAAHSGTAPDTVSAPSRGEAAAGASDD